MSEEPFKEEFDIICDLTKDGKVVKGVRFKITIDLINEGEIEALVIGDRTHFSQIGRLFLSGTMGGTIKASSVKEFRNEIEFDLISVGSIPLLQANMETVSTYDQKPVKIDNLQVKWKHGGIKKEQISFYLSGPQDFWGYLNKDQIDEDWNIIYENPSIRVPNFDGEVKFENKSFIGTSEVRGNYSKIETKKHGIVLIPRMELEVEGLKETAFRVIEILEKQISVFQRKRVYWYKYQIDLKEESILFIKTQRVSEDYKRMYHDSFLVNSAEILKFITFTYPQFIELEQQEFDITTPLNYYLSSFDIEVIDASFGMLFFALEKFLDEVVNKKGVFRSDIFDEKSSITFDDLKKQLILVIKESIRRKEDRKLIYEKINELNHPALKTTLREVLNYFQVKWDDLYQGREELFFVDIRNQIFHSNSEIEFPLLLKELIRLQAIFERLMLTFLKWEDLSFAPASHVLKRLKEKPQLE